MSHSNSGPLVVQYFGTVPTQEIKQQAIKQEPVKEKEPEPAPKEEPTVEAEPVVEEVKPEPVTCR